MCFSFDGHIHVQGFQYDSCTKDFPVRIPSVHHPCVLCSHLYNSALMLHISPGSLRSYCLHLLTKPIHFPIFYMPEFSTYGRSLKAILDISHSPSPIVINQSSDCSFYLPVCPESIILPNPATWLAKTSLLAWTSHNVPPSIHLAAHLPHCNHDDLKMLTLSCHYPLPSCPP